MCACLSSADASRQVKAFTAMNKVDTCDQVEHASGEVINSLIGGNSV